jgi:NAD+ synthase
MELDDILKIKDVESVIDDLTGFIKEQTIKFKKKGIIIGISGGIDSALTTALSVKALGKENVFGLMIPEKESSKESTEFAKLLINQLGIKSEEIDITQKLDAFMVYETRENIIKKKFPEYNNECKYRVVVPNKIVDEVNAVMPFLEVLDKNRNSNRIKLSLNDYLTLTAATSIKHRVRMTLEYFYAEKLNYLVVGSTNKSEWIQGYFVKFGDGGVDIEPIAELYKTQVYQLAKNLEIPVEIINRKASPDTWSYDVSDEEFFFGVPYKIMDILWYTKENDIPISKIGKLIDLEEEKILRILGQLEKKALSSENMRKMPPVCTFSKQE